MPILRDRVRELGGYVRCASYRFVRRPYQEPLPRIPAHVELSAEEREMLYRQGFWPELITECEHRNGVND